MKIAIRKVLRDLWGNKSRTILVVISIAVGVMAIGMIISTNSILGLQMSAAQIASFPSHGKMYLSEPIDYETVAALARLPEIAETEGVIEASIRWKPTLDSDWLEDPATLIALNDYDDQSFDRFELLSGKWPDSKSLSVEFNHAEPFGVPAIGNRLYLEVNERARPITVGGLLRDPAQFPPPNTQFPAFYVTREMMASLTELEGFNLIRFTVPQYSESLAEDAAEQIELKLKKLNVEVTYVETNDPEKHPLQDIINGVGMVLAVMAVMSLGLSTLLVINTVNAIISQQIPQIGVMKTIGGVRQQIINLYLAGVGIYGLLSLVLAIPLGALGGSALSGMLLHLLNIPAVPFQLLGTALLLQILAGLLAPLLAALWPVIQGASITVREAISSYGLGTGQYGTRRIDKLLGRIRGIPRITALPLRNTFRSIGRFVLTQLTLVGAGALFLTVQSTGSSLSNTIDESLASFGYDIIVIFEGPQRMEEAIYYIESNPDIDRLEMWIFHNAKASVVGETGPGSDHSIALRGYPTDTEFYTPDITAGSDLDPAVQRALLLNQKLAEEMGLGVGDQIVLDLGGGKEAPWNIVGLVKDLSQGQTTAYMNREDLSIELNKVGKAAVAEITVVPGVDHIALVDELKENLNAAGLTVSGVSSVAEEKAATGGQISILISVLMVMTILVAVVGSVGLSGTISINVIERMREIGVMRAVGASSRNISFIFITEGVILGLLSWALSIPISIIAARFFVQALGQIVDLSVSYSYSVGGVITWLIIITILSFMASWLPARRATQISVAESLTYG